MKAIRLPIVTKMAGTANANNGSCIEKLSCSGLFPLAPETQRSCRLLDEPIQTIWETHTIQRRILLEQNVPIINP